MTSNFIILSLLFSPGKRKQLVSNSIQGIFVRLENLILVLCSYVD